MELLDRGFGSRNVLVFPSTKGRTRSYSDVFLVRTRGFRFGQTDRISAGSSGVN